jgi:inosose dehydratase
MLEVGNAPLSWGVFEGDAATNPRWETVLDEIVEAGYRRLELGPIGFLPEDLDVLRDALGRRGLQLTAGFVYEHLHDPARHELVLRNARRVGRILSALGARYVVLMDRMTPERQATAGRGERAERLAPDAWDGMVETFATVARTLSDEFGLRPVLHPHAGGHVEFPDEIERALDALPHETLGLCVDTAHSAVVGLQAADLVDRYGERLEYFHFKDVDGTALRRMLDEDLDFDTALGVGLFCPIGQGIVDWVALREALERIGFRGLATVEQDPDPRVDLRDYSGLDAARASIAFLREVGLAHDERAVEAAR